MKKTLALILSLVMILSLAVVFASANPGVYVTGEEDFQVVGDLPIVWDADAASKLDVTDGDMKDWIDAGYRLNTISPRNMISWVDAGLSAGGESSMPEGWGLSAYFVADKDYLYIGFYTVDDDVVCAPSADKYNTGDAFQFAIDFDRVLGKYLESNEEYVSNVQCIFYSFSPLSTSVAPVELYVQWTDDTAGSIRDGIRSSTSEEYDMNGVTAMTEDGWCAEFCISWQDLYDDFAYRAYAEGANVYVGDEDPLEMNCALYYLNCDTGTGVNWAAGTVKGQEAGVTPEVTWAPLDNGMSLNLPWSADLEFTCENIKVLAAGETAPDETLPTPGADIEEDLEDEEEDEADATEAATSAATSVADAATNAADGTTEEGGCASVVALGSVAVLLSAMAAAVALKKKD